eukprot:TRINITY_DN9512_c0_g1_i1.p1 TRINITY_DN9512_c0_g1~~TRINITY_DN9512_c0_g1_i1.p1  ORF type:complete len:432 (-),score=95.42 TRINITY_DN9512_c0_g1_i1:261-1556(-)
MSVLFAQSTNNYSDRFIPNRSALNKEVAHYNLVEGSSAPVAECNSDYIASITQSLFGQDTIEDSKILALKNKAPMPRMGYSSQLSALYSQNVCEKAKRVVPKSAIKVLDAPGLVDDYYLNLLDWSQDNVVAIALGSSVYLWNAETSETHELVRLADDKIVTSVSFAGASSARYLAVGTEDCMVQLWDVNTQTQLRQFADHSGRVSSLAWNQHVLSTGSQDTLIINNDVRMSQHKISTFAGHEGEICGLKWSKDGSQLASGGNDNILNLWSPDKVNPTFTLTDHVSAVKALDWCPWQNNLLASGGGAADRTIKFWNTTTGQCLNSVTTDSQVCSLQWSQHEKEIVSSHGFAKNQLTVWKYPTMEVVGEMTGHTSRALHTAQSPDGTTILSASPDQTLRFWKVWEEKTPVSFSKPVMRNKSAKSNSSSISKVR